MLLRGITATSLSLVVVGLALLYAATTTHAATGLLHGGNASGIPYYNGQIQSNNYTSYATERNTAMNNWQTATGRRYIDAWTTGETMTQYVVNASSQEDTDLATWFGVNSCKWWHDNGYAGYRSFELGHHSSNRDSYYTVICLFVTAYGYTPAYGDLAQDAPIGTASRIRGMTHEMGHSLHLGHDSDGAMSTCWCYNINSAEAYLVNLIYASAP